MDRTASTEEQEDEEDKRKRDTKQQEHKRDPAMKCTISKVLCAKTYMAHQTTKYGTGDTGFYMDLKNA
jgi:hypothetical protein